MLNIDKVRLGSSVVEQTFHKRLVVSPILTPATMISEKKSFLYLAAISLIPGF